METNKEEMKTDLKHDNMEFTTPSNGIDAVNDSLDEDGDIGAEELNAIEDKPDNEAAALNATEIDLQADDDQLPDEDWTDDLPDKDEEEEKNHRRSS